MIRTPSIRSTRAPAGAAVLVSGRSSGSVTTLVAAGGTLAIAGGPAAFGVGLAAGGGTLALAGGPAAMGVAMVAGGGTLALAGGAAALSAGVILVASGGVLSLAGGGATLGPALVAGAGSLAIAGGGAGLVVGLVLVAAPGVFSVAGGDAAFGVGLLADVGVLSLAGGDATLAPVITSPILRLVDPDLATLVLAPSTTPLPYRTPAYVVAGEPVDIPVQCWDRLRAARASFDPGDTPSAQLLQGSASPIGVPSASWYTAGSAQPGYAQGQPMASLAAADTATLAPGLATLLIWVAPAADPSSPELVARVRLIVETPY